jgi:putative tryptophan/tyrosine transport system substrate-binding protein
VTLRAAAHARSVITPLARFVVVLMIALSAPDPGLAQQPRPGNVARIGRLSPPSAETDAPNLAAFRAGLRDLGWVEGWN